MKKRPIVWPLIGIAVVFAMLACGCESSNDYSRSSSYDYDKGYGYSAPKKGESFSEYLKRQDPDLYREMEDQWNSLR